MMLPHSLMLQMKEEENFKVNLVFYIFFFYLIKGSLRDWHFNEHDKLFPRKLKVKTDVLDKYTDYVYIWDAAGRLPP